jgi:long-subunit fatty acid transport protein
MRLLKILMVFLFTSSLFAQNFNDAFRLGEQSVDYDARTLALGNSTMSSLGNFSSAFLNPAALATIKRDVLTLSFNVNTYNNSADFLDQSISSDRKSSNTSQFSFILPLPVRKGSAVLAFGYNQIRDFNSTLEFDAFNSQNATMIEYLTNSNFITDRELAWDLGLNSKVGEDSDLYETSISSRLNQSGKLIEEGSLDSWVFSGAAEVAKNLFVGATFNIYSGEYTSNREFYEDDIDNIYSAPLDPSDSSTTGFEYFYLNDIVDWSLTGWDFRLGILYKQSDFLTFGATVKFPTTFTVEENFSIYSEAQFTENLYFVDYPEGRQEYEITTPMEFSGGITASFPFINASASAKFVDYSQLEFSGGFNSDDRFIKNEGIVENFESTLNWNIGIEASLPYPAVKLRGGFMYMPSPYKGDDSDFDKKYTTAGLGFPLAKRLLVDFAYMHGWWKTYGDNYGTDLSRTNQDIKVDKIVFSLSYIFM